MAYIPLPELDNMPEAIQQEAQPLLAKTGALGEIFRLLAVREDVFFATDRMAKAYLLTETELPYATKERIALLVSLANNCPMCVGVHKGIARMLGMREEQIEEVMGGVDAIQCGAAEKALLRFCLRAAAKDNYKIDQADIDVIKAEGWSDTQLLEAVAVTAYFNYINTLSNVFGLGRG